MTRKKRAERKQNAPLPSAQRRSLRNTVLFVGAASLGALLGLGWWNNREPPSEPLAAAVKPVETTATHQPQGEAQPSEAQATAFDLRQLQGQWVRPDGGYVIDIKSVDDSGKLDATYLNPNPIHVARAEVSREGDSAKVFIELRDINYPGSTYDLTYDPRRDVLLGLYFQAAQQQRFDVIFERVR